MTEAGKCRAVIYCRVSTQEQTQKDALKIQVEEAKRCVRENGWILADEYIEMESGTTKSGRSEYRRLLSDMHASAGMDNGFDVIVIKSLDRLNRCAKNWYLFVEELVQCDKQLYIYMDRTFYRTDDNLFAGIKAILAEQYSRDLSRKVNAAHAYRQKNGTTVLLNNNTYGYRKNADKTVSVEEAEAEMIKQIYLLAAQGRGAYFISNLLFEQGIRNRNGKQLGESTIRRIVRNPLYKGVVVMNRRHFDFEKKRMIENPSSEWIVHEGMVPMIVDEALWERANQRMGWLSGKRKKMYHALGQNESDVIQGCSEKDKQEKSVPESKLLKETTDYFENDKQMHRKKQMENEKSQRVVYNFSGKIVCGVCGEPYYKTFRRRGKNKQEIVIEWKCSRYLKHGRKGEVGCDNVFLGQKEMEEKVEEEAEQYLGQLDEQNLVQWILEVMESVLCQEEKREGMNKKTLEKILKKRKESLEKKQNRLLELLLEDVVKDDVYKKKTGELKEECRDVEKKLAELQRNIKKDVETEGKKRIPSGRRKIEEKLFSDGIRRIKGQYYLLQVRKIKAEKAGISIDRI